MNKEEINAYLDAYEEFERICYERVDERGVFLYRNKADIMELWHTLPLYLVRKKRK